jgi:hypothetical protein
MSDSKKKYMVLGPYFCRVESSMAARPDLEELPATGFFWVLGSGNPVLLVGWLAPD